MTAHAAAVLDTSVIAALRVYDPSEPPGTILITAVTLGEPSFGPHATDDPVKRAGRVAVLQHVKATFDLLPYDQARRLYSCAMSQEDLALLLRLNKSWHDGISAEDLYEITRAWWVMSPANAQRVARVLAVAGGIVREVYQPTRWLRSPVEGLENRIGFDGVVASDRLSKI